MAKEVRFGLVSIVPHEDWTREAHSLDPLFRRTTDTGPMSRQFVLGSPRGEGQLHLETVAMPDDMGAFDCDRLRKLIEQQDRSPVDMMLHGEPFDRLEWSANGVACVGYSTIWKVHSASAALSAAQPRGSTPLMVVLRNVEPGDLLEGGASRPPAIHRDWYLARGSLMANVWYRGTSPDHAAADIADCEDMIRSIRFE